MKKPVEAKKLVPLKSGIVNLMATSVDSSTNMTKADVSQEKMRMTFRDYFMYAVSGKSSDPSQAGQCSIQTRVNSIEFHQKSTGAIIVLQAGIVK